MPSRALLDWQKESNRALGMMEGAHRSARAGGPGSRFAAQQLSQAYVLLLCARFQRFCRDLHTESAEHLLNVAVTPALRLILWSGFIRARRLDVGNANPGNIGADFGRLGIALWDRIRAGSPRNVVRQRTLEEMNAWRNAVAHQDFSRSVLNRHEAVAIRQVRRWRSVCDRLAVELDRTLFEHLLLLTGVEPWKEAEE
jgi:hypothetical protein